LRYRTAEPAIAAAGLVDGHAERLRRQHASSAALESCRKPRGRCASICAPPPPPNPRPLTLPCPAPLPPLQVYQVRARFAGAAVRPAAARVRRCGAKQSRGAVFLRCSRARAVRAGCAPPTARPARPPAPAARRPSSPRRRSGMRTW
jgi:hypothetical protein